MQTQIRSAEASEIDHLARLWHAVWHETHAPLQPAELVRLRTLESFRDRLRAGLPDVCVTGPAGAPLGFYGLKHDELCHLFISPAMRGTGLAAMLLADAEARLAKRGIETAFLLCAIGNQRAARFYEKNGWRLTGAIMAEAETSAGPFPLEEWRYEKRLAPRA